MDSHKSGLVEINFSQYLLEIPLSVSKISFCDFSCFSIFKRILVRAILTEFCNILFCRTNLLTRCLELIHHLQELRSIVGFFQFLFHNSYVCRFNKCCSLETFENNNIIDIYKSRDFISKILFIKQPIITRFSLSFYYIRTRKSDFYLFWNNDKNLYRTWSWNHRINHPKERNHRNRSNQIWWKKNFRSLSNTHSPMKDHS